MRKVLVFTCLILGFAATTYAAPFTNGNFDAGLSPWTGSGVASVGGTVAGQGPLSAPNQAIVQTLGGIPFATLATNMGTSAAAISGITGGAATNGSGITQSWVTGLGANATIGFGIVNLTDTGVNSALLVDNVSVSDDGTLTFQWNFLTDEVDQNPVFNDTAFLVVNGAVIFLEDKNGIGFDVSVEPGFDGQSGWQTFSQNFAALQNPEPASMLAWGLIAGVGAVGYRLRKRKAMVAA